MTDKELAAARLRLKLAYEQVAAISNPMLAAGKIKEAALIQFEITEELARRELVRTGEVSP